MPDMEWPNLAEAAHRAKASIRKRVKARHASRFLAGVTVILLIIALIVGFWPLISRSMGDRSVEKQASQVSKMTERFPYNTKNRNVEETVEYNRRLLESGQPILGQASDPFTGETTSDFDGTDDPEYQKLLNVDGLGTMGEIIIPSIGVDLPIRHGSSGSVLEHSAGHLHGTSLPVGGKGSHAVITAHSNYGESTMFDRLTELKEGDGFYLKIMGRTLAYKVNRIKTVPPSGTSSTFDLLRAQKGKDLVTLMTCTGNGNSMRLLVTGERNRMPDQMPYLEQAPGDKRQPIYTTVAVVFAVLTIGFLLLALHRHKNKTLGLYPPQHERQTGRKAHAKT